MKTKILIFIISIIFINGFSASSHAALISRAGGTMVYDTDLNITWLADTNYAKTSGYDADGLMTWFEANNWANNLSYGGFDNWRLPSAINLNGTICNNLLSPNLPCNQSELGHLFFIELGGTIGETLSNNNLFIHLQKRYWTETENGSNQAWTFSFEYGRQFYANKTNHYGSWVVRDGDVTSIPEPSTILILSSYLLGLFTCRKMFKK